MYRCLTYVITTIAIPLGKSKMYTHAKEGNISELILEIILEYEDITSLSFNQEKNKTVSKDLICTMKTFGIYN